jgi:uncharacterized protein
VPRLVCWSLGNPLLNPAVLVFLFFVAPWQWTVTRAVVGIATVIGVAVSVGLVTGAREAGPPPPEAIVPTDGESARTASRFVRALVCLGLVLLPEYAIMVFVIGSFRGWLVTLTQPPHQGLLIVVLAAIVGTLLVIPTAGEIPILQSLALVGASSGTLGALLITLPAISVPGVAMVARSFGWKAIGTATVVVVAAGLLGGSVLSVL